MPINKLKHYKKFVISIFILLLFSYNFAPISKADGGVFYLDPYSDRWDVLDESSQEAIITHRDGIERMMIAVGIEESTQDYRDAVWIFPIPSNPKSVKLDVISEMPEISGEDVVMEAQRIISAKKYSLYASQVYTWPLVLVSNAMLGGISPGGGIDVGGGLSGTRGIRGRDAVVVHSRLNKLGITSEVITAKTSAGIQNYLKRKGFEVNNLSTLMLGDYVGNEYSFVVSWISPSRGLGLTATQRGTKRGLSVSFPTKDIYYPLKPTSVYGDKVIPLELRVEDFVKPKLQKGLRQYTEVSYYIDDNFKQNEGWEQLKVKDPGASYEYTKIKINAPLP